jgi:hypothetical protein
MQSDENGIGIEAVPLPGVRQEKSEEFTMNRFALRTLKLVAVACAVLFGAQCALGQATTGSFFGQVTDASKAVVPQAQVTATNQATETVYEGATAADGDYTILNVPPGTYTLSVSKQGFEQAATDGLVLVIDQKIEQNFQLTVGALSTVATVTAGAPLLQTQSVETGQVIESRQILDLPLLGRNFLNLALLTTGVVYGSGGNTLNLSVNGQREFANSVLIDGVEETGNRNNDTNLRPSVDAVEEFKVATSDYSAEYGRAAGGVISIQTKGGSNDLHGDLYEFNRPNATAADNFSFSGPGQSPNLSQNNFGGTVGGPIKKDKSFFFVSYEQERLRNTITYLDSVPPQNQITYNANGSVNLSKLLDPGDGLPVPIFNPAFYAQNYYSEQFPGNVIPACAANFKPDGSCVSPAGLAVLKDFFPMPNLPGIDDGYYDNFLVNSPYAYNAKTGSGRFDQVFSPKDRLSVVYHYADFNSLEDDPFYGAIPVVGGGGTDSANKEDSRSQELSVTETHLFSNKFDNEFRFGYSRYRLNQLSLLNGENLATEYDQPNVNLTGFPSTSGFPQIYLGSGWETGGSTYEPLYFLDSNFQVQDNMILSGVGKHEFHFGGDFRRLNSHPNFSLFPTGFQYYAGPYIYAPNGPLTAAQDYSCCYNPNEAYYQGGSEIADLLLGLPQTDQLGLQLTNPHTQSWEIHFYGEDTYKISPRLTLIYGVRYEYQNPYTEANNDMSDFDPTTKEILVAGVGGNSSALLNARKNDFSPRIGIAYQLGARTVIRAGYGLFYTPENDAREDVLTKNYPFAVQQVFYNSPYSYPFTYQIDSGVARETTIPLASGQSTISPATIPEGSDQTIYYVDPNMKTGYAEMYNLTLERELSSTMTVDVAYVGTSGKQLPYAIGNINLDNDITTYLGKIEAQESVGWSTYNSLQIKATKQATRNLTFVAAYTYAHNIDNGPAPFDLGVNHNEPQNPFNLMAEKASADDDIRHNFVFSATYSLPFGAGQQFGSGWHGPENAILGGWQINSIFIAHTGTPVNVVQNGNNSNQPGLRPNLIADPNLPSGMRTLQKYFNTSAFCTPNTTTCKPDSATPYSGYYYGDAGRNLIRGPGLVNVDFSIFKNFPFKERFNVQTRFEFFNLTNTPHFANPGGDASVASTFGVITGTIDNPRIIQFAGKFIF